MVGSALFEDEQVHQLIAAATRGTVQRRTAVVRALIDVSAGIEEAAVRHACRRSDWSAACPAHLC